MAVPHTSSSFALYLNKLSISKRCLDDLRQFYCSARRVHRDAHCPQWACFGGTRHHPTRAGG